MQPSDTKMTLNATVLKDHRVTVHGNSNLPQGTVLMVSVTETVPGFVGQSECSLSSGGEFQAEFGPVDDGVFEASAVMVLPMFQPPEVRRQIGENGERLNGPLLSDTALGPSITVAKRFVAGGSRGTARELRRAEEHLEQYRGCLNRLSTMRQQFENVHKTGSMRGGSDAFAVRSRRQLDAAIKESGAINGGSSFVLGVIIGLEELREAEIAGDSERYQEAAEQFEKDREELKMAIEVMGSEVEELKQAGNLESK
jgi:hypothetical protein